MSNQQEGLVRYKGSDRLNHWLIAILFVLASLGGLAMFHPSMFFLTGLFGGGSWTRILHPFIGSAMFVLFVLIFFKFWHHNVLTANDRKWLGQIGDVLSKKHDRLPEVGRYNGGQKAAFWVMVLTMILLVVSGLAFWRPYFSHYFSVDVTRVAALVHAVSAWVLILTIITHVYAALWVKGTIGAMWTGVVSRAWARKHHPGWFKEVTGGK
jgi:formate dehydrogenase subunit gamma